MMYLSCDTCQADIGKITSNRDAVMEMKIAHSNFAGHYPEGVHTASRPTTTNERMAIAWAYVQMCAMAVGLYVMAHVAISVLSAFTGVRLAQ